MYFWLFISIAILLVPLLMLVMGLLCWLCPPKGVCWYFGYRSRRATASDEVWLYAQDLMGKIWTITGGVLMVAALILCYTLLPRDDTYRCLAAAVALCVQIGLMICIIIPVEIVLHVRYDRFGNRRKGAAPKAEPAEERDPRAEEDLLLSEDGPAYEDDALPYVTEGSGAFAPTLDETMAFHVDASEDPAEDWTAPVFEGESWGALPSEEEWALPAREDGTLPEEGMPALEEPADFLPDLDLSPDDTDLS